MTPDQFKSKVLPLKNKLYAFAMSFLSNSEEARDIVQDVMVKIWEENKSIEEYRSIEAWCMTLTRNRALDRIKRKDYRQEDVTQMYDLHELTDSPDVILEKTELLSKIKKLVSTLPAKQREIFVLRDYQEHSYEEIAEILQIELNQVKVYLHRARKFIKEEITKVQLHGI